MTTECLVGSDQILRRDETRGRRFDPGLWRLREANRGTCGNLRNSGPYLHPVQLSF